MVGQLMHYLSFSFVRYALLVGVLISLCTSLLGVVLVLRRYSMIGDALSHVAFGTTAVAAIFNTVTDTYITIPATIVCAIFLIRSGKHIRVEGDASIAMLSVGSMAIGYLLLNMFPISANLSGDVCTTLFGSISILTLSEGDVKLCIILSIVVLLVYVIFYNKIFAITFDEDFADATGVKTNRYNLLIAVITAVVIVLAMNLVGALLISALIVFPALSSMRLFKNFKTVIISAAFIAVFSAAIGIIISILIGTPVGSTIVAAEITVFFSAQLVGSICGGK